MPKHSNFPTLFDEVLQINISKLNEWGYLKPGFKTSTTIQWSREGRQMASIGLLVNMDEMYIILNYHYGDQLRRYRVWIVAVPSNLGRGVVYYFRCPNTGKRCRILYQVGGYFLHRDASPGSYYESQIQGKRMRTLERMCKPVFKRDQLYEELNKPYFKRHYDGKPTRRYAQINKLLDKASRVSVEDFDRAFAGIL